MTQTDRGAYTPQTDAPLAFDARSPRGGRRPPPLALIGSGVVLLVLIVAIVLYYRSGVKGSGGAEQAVGQPVGEVKTAAAPNAQDDPFSNLDVYASQNVPATPPAPVFAPPPEQPAPRPAAAAGLKVQTVDPNPARPIPAPAAAPTAPVATAQLAPALAPPAKPAAPAAATPAPVKTAAAPPAPAPVKVAAAPPAPAPAAKPPPAPVLAAAPSGPAAVQIGAYSSTALADKGYTEVASAFPGQMAGKSKRVEPLERDGKTLYRGLIGGFASKDAAQAFCNTLKAAGRVCLVRG